MYAWDQVRLRRASFYSPDVIEAGLSHLEAALPRFRALCENIGARPLVAVIPDHATLEGPHPSSAIAARAIELARAAGFVVEDLSPTLESFAASSTDELTIPFDGHYTAVANRAMATRMAELLTERE